MKKQSLLSLFVLAGVAIALPTHQLIPTSVGYDLTLSFGLPEIVDTVVNGQIFSVVRFEGCGYEGKVGQAATPVAQFDLAVSGTPSITVTHETAETLTLAHPILPMPLPRSGNDVTERPFAIDKNWYLGTGTDKATSSVEKLYSIRDIQGGYFAVRPVTYTPSTGRLIVRTSATASIATSKMIPSYAGTQASDKIARGIFLNLENTTRSTPPAGYSTEKYLIITADRYASNTDLARFVEFRKKGFDVKVVNKSVVGTTTTAFASYIKKEAPAYVLLVGQFSDFPTKSYPSLFGSQEPSAKSYLPYIDNGTGRPSTPLGLFFFRTETALKNIVDKTIYTANNLDKYPNDYICFSGNNGDMGSIAPNHIDKLFTRLETSYWKPMQFTVTKVYACSAPNKSDASVVVKALNKGARFLNYNGHGADYGWSFSQTPSNELWGEYSQYQLSVNDFGTISNTIYPFVISCACVTGIFEKSYPCWAETWIGHKNLGVGFIGSEQNSSMNQHAMNYELMEAIKTKDITRFGDMFVYAINAAYTRNVGDNTIQPDDQINNWGCQEYHLFGDPALETMKPEIVADPFVTVSSPNGNEQIEIGSSVAISWTDNIDDSAKIELLKSGSVVSTIVASTASDGSFSWIVPETISAGKYTIRVSVGTLKDVSDAEFSIVKVVSSGNLTAHKKCKWYTETDENSGATHSTATLDTSNVPTKGVVAGFVIGKSDEAGSIWTYASLVNEPDTDLSGLTKVSIIYTADYDMMVSLVQSDFESSGAYYQFPLKKTDATRDTIVALVKGFAQPLWAVEGKITGPLVLKNVSKFSFGSEVAEGESAHITIFGLTLGGIESTKIGSDFEATKLAVHSVSKNVLAVHSVGSSKINLTVPVVGTYSLTLYSLAGKSLGEVTGNLVAGNATMNWNGASLGHQLCIVSVKGPNGTSVFKAKIEE